MAKGSHGLIGKQNMYEHTVTVPMIFSGPAIRPGRRTDAIINQRDLFPTSCELAGVPVPGTVEGKSLAPVIRGETDHVHDAAYGYFMGYQRMIRRDGWKLIWYPHLDRYQLFHVAEDPDELHDLAGDGMYAGKKAELKAALTAWQESVKDPVLRGDLGVGSKSGKE
jgi:arylsulfatase A-like enzyme